MSRFGDAVYDLMLRDNRREISSSELWSALSKVRPDLTAVGERRKTPRGTMMRDLRKDNRFTVRDRTVRLSDSV